MDYTVLLDTQGCDHFVATVPALPGCRAEGRSREQALVNVRTSIAEMIAKVEVVRVSIDGPDENSSIEPWLEVIGQFRDDPTFDPMMRDVYRERSGEYPE